jgi:exopolysaccharide production protein ExoQ
MGRQVNLTDRTTVWAAVLAVGTDPIIGTGFGSFWLTPGGHAVGNHLGVTEAHNGFLETYLNSGMIGVGLLIVVLLGAGRNVLRQFSAGSPNAPLYASLFIAGLIYNYTEADFNTNSIVGFVLWAIAVRPESVQQFAVPDSANANDSGLKDPAVLNRPSIFATTTRKDA